MNTTFFLNKIIRAIEKLKSFAMYVNGQKKTLFSIYHILYFIYLYILELLKNKKNVNFQPRRAQVKIISYFYFSTSFLLFSIDLKAEPVYSIGSLMNANHRIEKTKEGEKPITKTPKESGFILLSGIEAKGSSENYSYELDSRFVADTVNPNRYFLVLGNQAYVSLKTGNSGILFGRKFHNYSNLLFPKWKDGSEGLSIDYKFNNYFYIQVDLLDYYRGFPDLYNTIFWTTKDSGLQKGNRFRNAIHLTYANQNHKAYVYFKYLNLGDWGQSSTDNKKQNPISDGDFLYTLGFHWMYTWEILNFGLGAILTRGLDKTNSHEIRKNSSLPISGECIKGSIQIQNQGFGFSYRFFLPDRDKKNSAKEVLETGFIGTGLNPSSGIIMPYILNFFPSGWISLEGLERRESYTKGRYSSFLNELDLSYSWENWKLGFFGSHYTPYLDKPSNGSIGLKRSDFSKLYLVETGLYLESGKKEKGNYFLRLTISHLNTSREIGIKSDAGFLEAGIYF